MGKKEKYTNIDPSYGGLDPIFNNSPTQSMPNNIGNAQIGNTDFGNSDYDKEYTASLKDIATGDYQFQRGEQQSGLGQLGLGVLRAISKAGIEAMKTPAYLYSLGEWSLDNIKNGDKGMTLDQALDNAWLENLESLDESIKESLPVYKSFKSGKGGLMDNIFSTSFWASDGADGVGYLLGMMVPGGIISKLGTISKGAKWLGASQKLANNIELGGITLVNTSVEALAEAKGVVDRLKESGASDEEIATAGRETFFANMGLLLAPNAIMNKALLGKATGKLDDFIDPLTGKMVTNQVVKKNALKEYSKALGIGIVSEGFVEEGGQTSIENYEVNKALGKTDKKFLEGVAEEYINTLGTTEGQKAIFLGAVLGGFGNVAGERRENKQQEKLRPIITKMIENNFAGFSKPIDIYDRDEQGRQIKINIQKLNEAFKQVAAEIKEAHVSEIANANGDNILAGYLENNQLTRYAESFFANGDLGLEVLNKHIDEITNQAEFIKQKEDLEESKNTKFDLNKYKQETKAKIKELYDVYNETKSTVSKLPSVQALDSNNPVYSLYVKKLTSAAYKEVSKQLYYKEQLNELGRTVDKHSIGTLAGLPQSKVIIDEANTKIEALHNLLLKSYEQYEALLSPEEQQKAFDEEVKDDEKLKENIKTAKDKKIIDDAEKSLFKKVGRKKSTADIRTEKELNDEFSVDSKSNVSQKHALNKIIESAYSTNEEKELAKQLLNKTNDNDVLTFKKDKTPGVYNSKNNSVNVDPRFHSSDYQDGTAPIETTILHELLHKYTVNQYYEDTEFQNKIDELYGFAYLHSKDKFEYYGLANPLELITEAFTSPSFQKYLSTIPYKNTNKTVWDVFLDLVSKTLSKLGFNTKDTLLNEVISVVSQKITTSEETKTNTEPEVNPLIDQALKTKSLDEFNALRIKLAEDQTITQKQSKELTKAFNNLIASINVYADNVKAGTVQPTPENQQFYNDNKEYIEARLLDLQKAEDAKPKPKGFTDYGVDDDGDVLGRVENDTTDDSDLVSEANEFGDSIAIGSSQEDLTPEFPKERDINSTINDVMMHVFNHYHDWVNNFKNYVFRFLRNNDGFPDLNLNSKVDLIALNEVQEGDNVELRYAELTDEAKAINATAQQNSINEGVKPSDFDGKYIGIYHNDRLIGFVREPHVVSPYAKDKVAAEENRQALITYRKSVIEKLNKGVKVTETIISKGNGNLYTKLNEEGKIDAIYKINDLNEQRGDKDKLFGQDIYIYADKDRTLKPALTDLNAKDTKELYNIIAELRFEAKPGAVFKLVKGLNGKYAALPVYANKMNDATADLIIETLSQFSNTSNISTEIIASLNPYIYAAQSKNKAFMNIKKDDDNITTVIWMDGKKFTLKDINSKAFKNALMTTKQNIHIKSINLPENQDSLNKRETLITNVSTFNGEFFIQPYIEYTQTIKNNIKQAEPQEEIQTSTTNPNTTTTTNKLKDIMDDDIDITKSFEDEDSLSTTPDLSKLDRVKFSKWLKSKLPQLSLSNIDSLLRLADNKIDAFGMFKDNVIYLFEGAGMRTAYHEAFHGVFRNLLSVKEREALYNEAKTKYEAPTQEQLNSLQRNLKHTYSKEQLTYLYYEEKLADAFGEFAYMQEDINFFKKLGNKIVDFFKQILEFFNILTQNDTSEIDKVFNKIVKGKMATINATSNSVVNMPIFNEFAYSTDLNTNLNGVSNKVRWTRNIGNRFMAIYQEELLKNNNPTVTSIYNRILNEYIDKYEELKKQNVSIKLITDLKRILTYYPDLVNTEVKKYLSFRGVQITTDLKYDNIFNELILSTGLNTIDITPSATAENSKDESQNGSEDSILSLESKTTKGLAEWVTIAGLTSASKRLKMFLSSIPAQRQEVIDNKLVITNLTDEFGLPVYHDFAAVYYFIEDNLIDVYTLEEQLEKLNELSRTKPELQYVIDRLTNKPSNFNDEQFELLRNDFKTNFSKQQLVYSLVKFDSDASTGNVTFDIIEANRNSLGREIREQWISNLNNPQKNGISIYKKDKIINYGTPAAKELLKIWNTINVKDKQINFNRLNTLLNQAGIEMSENTLLELLTSKDTTWRNNITAVLNYYAADDSVRNGLNKSYNENLSALIGYELLHNQFKHTSSFINGANENIYTIQLPSFISRTLAKIRDKDKFDVWYKDLLKDPYYKNSNLLALLKNSEYRKKFKVTYLDSLKDARGKREGLTFTELSPSDWLATQIALFQNTNANKGNQATAEVNKYTYIVPSDKTMSLIIDSITFGINLSEDGKSIANNSPILTNFYNIALQQLVRITHNTQIKKDIIDNKGKGKYQLINLLENYHIKKSNFDEFTKFVDKDRNNELTDKDWSRIDEIIDGEAFIISKEILTESFSNDLLNMTTKDGKSISDVINESTVDNVRDNIENLGFMKGIIDLISNKLMSEINVGKEEMLKLGIISQDKNGLLNSNIIDTTDNIIEEIILDPTKAQSSNTPEIKDRKIRAFIAKYYSNTLLHNIEFSNIFNGDIAMYKPGDLQKRTYQSQSMIVNPNFQNKKINTLIVKDHYSSLNEQLEKTLRYTLKYNGLTDDEVDSVLEEYLKDSKGNDQINVTDAQVLITPEFYRNIHIARGTWSPLMQKAHDILEGNIVDDTPAILNKLMDKISIKNVELLKTKDVVLKEKLKNEIDNLTKEEIAIRNERSDMMRALGAIKPFYFGNRFDEKLGIHIYEQVKCSMFPLYKAYVNHSPLLAGKLDDMINVGADMLAFESSFKGAIGYRNSITEEQTEDQVIALDSNNFGIQVDNPDHMIDGNSSLRQLRMLMMGIINTKAEYNGLSGQSILDTIQAMESENIDNDLDILREKLNFKNNTDFAEFIKEMVTKRNSTIALEEAFTIENGDFKYALDQGNISTQAENMMSSIMTSNAIKQEFTIGGSGVQATALGFEYKNLKEQQQYLTREARLLQSRLKWIDIAPYNGKPRIEYAECAMPSWTRKFFNIDGTLKNINDIPDELKTLIMYRIPTEGLHSMLPIKVVEFLPEEMGNFILLPYEITRQFGADFDFDKVYFIGRDFYKDKNGEFTEFKYITGTQKEHVDERYTQYSKVTPKAKKISREDFAKLPISKQNVKEARNNKIFDNYIALLTDVKNLELLITPSGFEKMNNFSREYRKSLEITYGRGFFSSITQRDYKYRNHTGIALKGQAALHVSGHSYAVLMNLTTDDGSLDITKSINFNGEFRTEFNNRYTDNKKLIADELSMIMAAILDDIKNPILAKLGINNKTIDVLATIIRAGYSMNTALSFTSQKVIKEASDLLIRNNAKIKKPNEESHTIDSIIDKKSIIVKQLILDNDLKDNPTYAGILKFVTSEYGKGDNSFYNLTEKQLSDHLKNYTYKKGNLMIFKGESFEKASVEEQIDYYLMDVRLLIQYKTIDSIATKLVDINKFFAINKEVGPNIEDIISKQTLYENITSDDALIKGFDIEKIPTLKSTWEVHKEALSFFENYFGYSSEFYVNIKQLVTTSLSDKTLDKVSVKDRMYMNHFIKTFTDYIGNNNFQIFNETLNEFDSLYKDLPSLINDIRNIEKADTKMGRFKYSTIKKNAFIEQLKIKYDKDNKISNISLRGNRLDTQVKNNIIEGLNALYSKNDTRKLAIDLIKHVFLSTGFFKGINSYYNLISPDLMNHLGYNQFRKEIIRKLQSKSLYLNKETTNRLLDQLIRNNLSTLLSGKKFDPIMFDLNEDKPLPNKVTSNYQLANTTNRVRNLVWGTKDSPSFANYIGIYDKVNKKIKYFKLTSPWTWEQIEPLGIPGRYMEINPFDDLVKSKVKYNNVEDSESEEAPTQGMIDSSTLPNDDNTPTSEESDVKQAEPPTNNSDQNLPNNIKPCE